MKGEQGDEHRKYMIKDQRLFRIKYLKNQKNKNVGYTVNEGNLTPKTYKHAEKFIIKNHIGQFHIKHTNTMHNSIK